MTKTEDLPLSDPRNPLHRPATAKPAATPAPAQTAPVVEQPKAKTPKAKAAKATKPAKGKKAKSVSESKTTPKRTIVPLRYKQAYANHDDTNGSKLSLALKAFTTITNKDGRASLDLSALRAVAKQNGIDVSKYEKLNNGQFRMNVSNRLAGKLKQGETVTVGRQKFASETAVKPAAHVDQAA